MQRLGNGVVERQRFILLEHLLPDMLGAYGRIRYQNHGLELDDISYPHPHRARR